MMRRLILFVAVALSACASARNPFMWKAQRSTVQVFYVTDREPVGAEYGPARGTLRYGIAEVDVLQMLPRRQADLTPSPVAPMNPTVSAIIDSSTHFEFRRATEIPESTFFRLVADAYRPRPGSQPRDSSVLLYVHGYNNGFDDVAERTAALAWRTSAPAAVMFDWPSRHKLLSYVTDLDQARWAAPDLRTFLEQLSAAVPPSITNVVVHSMGSQTLAYALALSGDVTHPWPAARRMRTLTFVDPDYDEELFVRDGLPLYRQFASRLTLYGTRRDVPLLMAAVLRSGYYRAGQVHEGTFKCPEDVDCVDITPALPSRGFLHHFDVLAPNSPLAIDFANAVMTANPGYCRAAEGKYIRRDPVWIMQPANGFDMRSVPQECSNYGVRSVLYAALPSPLAAAVAAVRAALAAEFGDVTVFDDSTSILSHPVLVASTYEKAQVDLRVEGNTIRAMITGYVARRPNDFENGSPTTLVEDVPDMKQQWDRLRAVQARIEKMH